MRGRIVLAMVSAVGCGTALAASPEMALKRYGGTWQITRKSAPDKKEELKNQCAAVGSYYVCQQSSGGGVSGLLVLTATSSPNRFNTQTVLPDGRATGKGELAVEGDKWTFSSTWNSGGATTRYRTVDTFTGPNKIQFTQEESNDGTHWQTKDSGEEVRVGR